MKRRAWSAAISLLLAAPVWAGGIPEPRQAELLNMLKHDCGSCHGLLMKGGLGPSLLPQSLAGKPDEYLAATILYGRPGTPMPPWGPFLSTQETAWLIQRIRGGLK